MQKPIQFHESYSAGHAIEGSSNRAFGLVVGAALGLFAVWPLWRGGHWRPLPLAAGALLGLVALARPAWLAPLNRWWTKLGLLLGAIVTPVIMAILLYLVFTPIGLMARVLGAMSLLRKPQRGVASYWKDRIPPGPPPDTMVNQF